MLIGAASLMDMQSGDGELGYWMGTEFWGEGYCTEACRRLVDFGLNDLELGRIHAHHLSRNSASGRVLLKCGLVHTGSGSSECGYRRNVESTELYERLKGVAGAEGSQ